MCQRGGLVQHHLSCFGFLSNMCSQHSCPTIADVSFFHDIYNRQPAPVLAVWQSHCHLQKVEAPVGCFLDPKGQPSVFWFCGFEGFVTSKKKTHNSQHQLRDIVENSGKMAGCLKGNHFSRDCGRKGNIPSSKSPLYLLNRIWRYSI